MSHRLRVSLGLLCMCVAATLAAPPRAFADDPPDDPEHPAAIVELTIPSYGARLPGHIYLASGPGPHPTVVLLHGFPGNERNLDLAQALRRRGFNTLFFHYRGAWGAEGTYRIEHLPQDARAVLGWLREDAQRSSLRIDTNALSVLGHSLGGYTALAVGAQEENLACVMALAPANLGLWKDAAEEGGPLIERLSAYADTLFMLEGLSGESFVEELRGTDREALDISGFGRDLTGKAVFMLVGDRDQATPPEQMFHPVAEAYRLTPGLDVTAQTLPTDHSFSGVRLELTSMLVGWANERCRGA